jgi:hypothetical protein
MKLKDLLWGETASAHRERQPRRCFATVLLVVFILLSNGCASGFVTVSPRVPDKYEKMGQAKGSACGVMLLDIPFICGNACAVVPVGLNDRVERAYQRALDSVAGSKLLINVTMQEDHYWWVIGDASCVTITGEAVR